MSTFTSPLANMTSRHYSQQLFWSTFLFKNTTRFWHPVSKVLSSRGTKPDLLGQKYNTNTLSEQKENHCITAASSNGGKRDFAFLNATVYSAKISSRVCAIWQNIQLRNPRTDLCAQECFQK